MILLIERLYQNYLDRTPSAEESIGWAVIADKLNVGADGLNESFLNSIAEAGTVGLYYRRLLKRDADDAAIKFWANNKNTVRQVIDGIKGSEEYKNVNR